MDKENKDTATDGAGYRDVVNIKMLKKKKKKGPAQKKVQFFSALFILVAVVNMNCIVFIDIL